MARWSTRLLQKFGWEVVNYHPSYSPDLAPSDFHLFTPLEIRLPSASTFSEWHRGGLECQSGSNPGGRLIRHRIQKLAPRYHKCLNSGGDMLTNSSTLAVSVLINLSIKLGFISVNVPRETYFVDKAKYNKWKFILWKCGKVQISGSNSNKYKRHSREN